MDVLAELYRYLILMLATSPDDRGPVGSIMVATKQMSRALVTIDTHRMRPPIRDAVKRMGSRSTLHSLRGSPEVCATRVQ